MLAAKGAQSSCTPFFRSFKSQQFCICCKSGTLVEQGVAHFACLPACPPPAGWLDRRTSLLPVCCCRVLPPRVLHSRL